MVIAKNNNTLFYVNATSLLNPTHQIDDNNSNVVASNTCTSHSTSIFFPAPAFAGAVFNLKKKDSIADSGATQIFVMDGTPVINKWKTTCPLQVALADGCVVTSTHMCVCVCVNSASSKRGSLGYPSLSRLTLCPPHLGSCLLELKTI